MDQDQQIQALGKQFVELYYTTLQTNRVGLISLYGQNSQMTYGGHKYKGLQEIQEKIESFGFQKIAFQIDDLDTQMSSGGNSFLTFVTGTLQMDDTDTFKFSQIFVILPNNSGGYFCISLQ